jgi:anaerobic magnesium-protoporphyrin IX monomethyl ester cyclase
MGRALLEKHAVVDAVVIGEGEGTMGEIVDRIGSADPLGGVAGILYRRASGIVDNGPRPLIDNVDDIPMPAYHLLPHLSRYQSRSRAFPVGYIFTSRGCPAACTFCYRNFGTKWRPRSPEKVVEEIAFLRQTYGIRQLDILDDNFSFDADRARRILELIIERRWDLKINLQIGVRVHSLTPELLKTMKRAGVFKFGFGIESGDAAMLRRIKKGLQLERAVELVRIARTLGLITHGYFIIGFPGDTPESMQRTIDFAKRLNPHYASFSVCTPLPGTEMYDDIARNGKFLSNVDDGIDEGLFALKAFFTYGDLGPEMVSTYAEKAWKEFYARPGKIFDVLTTVRSWGEFQWLTRVVGDMLRTKKG